MQATTHAPVSAMPNHRPSHTASNHRVYFNFPTQQCKAQINHRADLHNADGTPRASPASNAQSRRKVSPFCWRHNLMYSAPGKHLVLYRSSLCCFFGCRSSMYFLLPFEAIVGAFAIIVQPLSCTSPRGHHKSTHTNPTSPHVNAW